MSNDTKTRILDAAETIMLEKGFNGVGLNEVLAAVKVPKGSFYHYFPSKEQFGVELLQHYIADSIAYKRRMLLSTSPEPNPLNRILSYMESGIGHMCESEGKCPCLVLKLASEVASFSDTMRQVLLDGGTESEVIFQTVITEGIASGAIRKELEPKVATDVVQDLWMGAMHRAQLSRSVAPLRAALAFIRSYLSPQ